jgi:hypothetical protein
MLDTSQKLNGRVRSARILLMFLQADIDIAFSLLHLCAGRSEGWRRWSCGRIDGQGNSRAQNESEALAKQSFADEEACRLRRGITDLFEAIQIAERGLQVLLADPVLTC